MLVYYNFGSIPYSTMGALGFVSKTIPIVEFTPQSQQPYRCSGVIDVVEFPG